MAVLDFPANPVLNQEYNFPPFRYRWDGEKWRTIGTGANPVQTQIAEHKVEKDAHAIETITNLREELSALGGTPVLSVVWVQKRDAMWPGYVPADGQTLSRADYPDAWQAIADDKVPSTVNDSDWLNNPNFRGCFSPGDGSTTFRLPDYNGKYAGSYGATFLRGDGLNSAGVAGHIQPDALRSHNHAVSARWVTNSGVTDTNSLSYASTDASGGGNFQSVSTGDAETRPINVTGCWAIKLAGAAQNSGQIDALTLASQIAELQSWPQRGKTGDWEWVKHRDGSVVLSRLSVVVMPSNQSTTPLGSLFVGPTVELNYPFTLAPNHPVTVTGSINNWVAGWIGYGGVHISEEYRTTIQAFFPNPIDPRVTHVYANVTVQGFWK